MDEQRSRETRARAELALVRLLHALGDEDVFLVVLGGLVPEVLASGEALVPEHLGTTDVDVLLITHVDPDAGRERSFGRTVAERSAPRTFAAPVTSPATSLGRN
jgi:hypothetical protein